MRISFLICLIISLITQVSFAEKPANDSKKKEKEKPKKEKPAVETELSKQQKLLLGEWKVELIIILGNDVPPDAQEKLFTHITFGKKFVTARGKQPKRSYDLNVTNDLKEIDIHELDENGNTKSTLEGVFSIKDNVLKLNLAPPEKYRPGNTDPTNESVYLEMKREKTVKSKTAKKKTDTKKSKNKKDESEKN